jgi:crotonobetainyl-CoA:carnitine CoA-transferase CaiB-like acyl-CoA transferase
MKEAPPNPCAGPLSGIRVLDAATFLAAPGAASLLSEYGADVIKVEQPAGDTMRLVAPFRGDVSLWWKVVGRNRRSVALDLNNEDGRAVFRQLAAQCDIVIVNFRPDTLKKWGIAFEDLVQCRKDIVYFHLTAFGEGPYAQRPGFARVAEAFAGLTNRTGFPGQPPVQSGYPMLGDAIGGLYGAFAIMLALRQRDLTGQPQRVDLGLYEPILKLMDDLIISYDETGSSMARMGNSSPRWSPHGLFPTKDDRHALIACSTERLWQTLRAVIGDDSLKVYDNDPPLRVAKRAEIEGRVAEWARQYNLRDLVELCDRSGLAIGPVYTPEDIVNDPHIAARGSLVTVDDPQTGKPVRFAGPVGRFSGFEGRVHSLGPGVGEHTGEVLGELLDMVPAQVDALRAKGAIK